MGIRMDEIWTIINNVNVKGYKNGWDMNYNK